MTVAEFKLVQAEWRRLRAAPKGFLTAAEMLKAALLVLPEDRRHDYKKRNTYRLIKQLETAAPSVRRSTLHAPRSTPSPLPGEKRIIERKVFTSGRNLEIAAGTFCKFLAPATDNPDFGVVAFLDGKHRAEEGAVPLDALSEAAATEGQFVE